MAYATNDGVRIYYEREGSGPPLLLHHGYTMSIQDWRDDGYVAALKDKYELILMDPRGHGASDKPHDLIAYSFATRVADVVAVLDHAAIERAVFWGYSMGRHVGYAIARYAPSGSARSSSAGRIPTTVIQAYRVSWRKPCASEGWKAS